MEEAAPSNTYIDSNVVDRISKLPEHILSRILSSFDLKSAAKTCLLSKAWRYSWCNRSRLVFIPDPTLPLSVLDKILQSYSDRNLRFEHFALCTSEDLVDADEVDSLLHKWIPVLVQDMRVESLDLRFYSRALQDPFELPSLSLILESDNNNNIRNLSLLRCRTISTTVHVDLRRLQTLWLFKVYIPEEILDSILSNCPSIENLSLMDCKDFKGVKLLNNKNLTSLLFQDDKKNGVSVEIGDDMRSLRTMEIKGCLFSVRRNKRLEYASLARLSLTNVEMLSGLFSCTLHSLEELKLDRCKGIKELKLSSRSMKRLEICNVSRAFKAIIDAPSIVEFSYEGFLPQSISFAGRTTSEDLWKSKIILRPSSFYDHGRPAQYRFDEVYGLLKALSQSEISLELYHIDHIVGVPEEADEQLPVEVEHLRISSPERDGNSNFLYSWFFRMLRPSFVYMATGLFPDSKNTREIAALLLEERERMQRDDFLQRVLEGVSLQVKYLNQSQWQAVEHTEVSEKGEDGMEVELRIHLKWRD